jgi:hypothetical protein
MKRIVRLTESDLTRIVKRVIEEQANPVADKILSEIEYLCNNGKVEGDAMVAAVMKIKDQATYDAILKNVKTSPNFRKRQGSNFNLIVDWLTNKGMDAKRVGTPYDPVAAGYNLIAGTSTADKVGRHLQKFNSMEESYSKFS